MLRSTFHGIEVSKTGIYAQQTALYTTGHNMANANTVGYTRQTVVMQSSHALPYPGLQMSKNPGQIGTGVIASDIQRIRDQFLDAQYRKEIKHVGLWEAKHDALSQIEMILTEPSDTGLQGVLDQFWTSWQDLAKESDASSARAVVYERAQAVADTFAAVRRALVDYQKDLNTVVEVKASTVNSLTAQIADLNDQISRIEPHGYSANDLKDKRDVLIDELAKLVNVDKVESIYFADGRDTGMVRVMVGETAIVEGRTRLDMAVTANETTGLYDVTLGGAGVEFTSGEILGLIESRGYHVVDPLDPEAGVGVRGIIQSVIDHIDIMATEMAQKLNDIHSTGLTLDDIKNGRTLDNGDKLMFFIDKEHYEATGEYRSPTNAGNYMIHPDITQSLDKIAAGQPVNGGATEVGDGRNASAIASLKFAVIDSLPDTATFDDFYRNLIGEIGIQATEAERFEENAALLVAQVENRRISVSGVSLDEEVSNMIKFQHAYNASSRMITTMDEILDKIINGMGVVGR